MYEIILGIWPDHLDLYSQHQLTSIATS